MKQFLCCLFSTLTITCTAQGVREIDRMINQNRGTYVIREIRKKKELSRDSVELSVSFFSGFCQLIKSDSPNSITFFLIDSHEYTSGVEGSRVFKVKNGTHFISIIRRENSLYYSNFSPIRELRLKLRGRRYYVIDVYLSRPFLNNQ